MNRKQYTHGPWNVEAAQRGFIVTALNGQYDIAVVRNIGEQDNKANAQLIAAAPELLSSNKELAAIVRALCAALHIPLPEETLSRSDKAIAKAEGNV